MFGEPAWYMLLELYSRGEQGMASVADLADLAGGPASTAGRWIDYLEEQELVRRSLGTLTLTGKSRGILDSYFSRMLGGRH